MTKIVNIHEAKTHLSRLIRTVEAGEEVVIARGGEPVARLVRVDPVGTRLLGMDRGTVYVSEDFDEPLDPAVLDEFEE